MSYVVSPFEVASEVLPAPAKVRFVHLMSGIATRHSDTIDAIFRVNGRRVTVSIWCQAVNDLRQRDGKYLSDQQLADIAALHLRRTLEAGYDPTETELFIDDVTLRRLGRELGYL